MHDGILNYTKFGNLLIMAAPAGWQGGSCPPVPYALPPAAPSYRDKKLYVLSSPFPFIVAAQILCKNHEMCQNMAQSIPDFFLFPVVNGQGTCC